MESIITHIAAALIAYVAAYFMHRKPPTTVGKLGQLDLSHGVLAGMVAGLAYWWTRQTPPADPPATPPTTPPTATP